MILFRCFVILLGIQLVLSQSCNTLTPPTGMTRNAVALPVGGIATGVAVAPYVTAAPGKTCTGAATATCLTAGGTATSAGTTCTNNACTGAAITTILGMSLSGTAIPASVSTDDNLSTFVTATAGYTCTGTPLAVCTTAGANPVTTTGMTCVANACTAGTLTLPNGLALSGTAVPGSVATATVLTAFVTQANGFTCTGIATASCLTAGANPATVMGITCPANACTQGTLTPPTGSALQGNPIPASISTGIDVTGLLTAAPGYACTGTAVALCSTAGNNPATATYACTANACTGGLTRPAGSSASGTPVPASISTGTDVSALVTPTAGWTCTGTAMSLCTTAGASAATTTGLTCTANACTGGLTRPAGSSASGTPVPASISTGADVSALVTPTAGWTCTGTAMSLCTTAGASAATTTGLTCTANACTGGLTPPAGAQLAGTAPTTISTGNDVSASLTAQTGFTCVNAAIAVCATAGANAATTTGMTCSTITCTGLTPPAGAQRTATTLPGTITPGLDVSIHLTAQAGQTCTGTPTAVCATAGAVATTTGMTCVASPGCTGGLTPPANAQRSAVALPASIAQGVTVTQYLAPVAGYTCTGIATAVCGTPGAVAAGTAGTFACVALSCNSVTLPAGITNGNVMTTYSTGQTITTVDRGYTCTGTRVATCLTAGGAATIPLTCTAISCTGGLNIPLNAQQSTVTLPTTINSGTVLTQYVVQPTGVTCTGTPVANCATAGPNRADVIGYTCTQNVCTAGLVQPANSVSTITGAVTTGQVVTAGITAATGFMCVNPITATCVTAGSRAVVTPPPCTGLVCALGMTPPTGTTTTSTAAVTSGDVVTQLLTVSTGYSCTGTPVASCTNTAVRATVTGYTCTLTSGTCTFPTNLVGYTFAGGANCNTVALCGTVTCATGYNGATPTIACPANGIFTVAGCALNQCQSPGNSFPGYTFANGNTCTSTSTCGVVSCSSGYRQVSTPAYSCNTNGGTLSVSGCSINTCTVGAGQTGYVFGSTCTSSVTTCTAQCATGYTGTATPLCVVNGGSFTAQGCSQAGTVTSSPGVKLPTRSWKRSSLRFFPPYDIISETEQSGFIIALEQKLRAASDRFRTDAELKVSLLCVSSTTTCYRPDVNWERSSRSIQALGTTTQEHTADVIVSDYNPALVDQDLGLLQSAVQGNGASTGPIFNNYKDIPLRNAVLNINTADQLVTGPVSGGTVSTPTPVPGGVSSDDDALPTWAIILIVVGVLLCFCIIVLCYCYNKKKKNKEREQEMTDRDEYKADQFGQAGYNNRGAGSTSAEEAANAARIQNNIDELERRKAGDYGNSPPFGGYGASPGFGSPYALPQDRDRVPSESSMPSQSNPYQVCITYFYYRVITLQ